MRGGRKGREHEEFGEFTTGRSLGLDLFHRFDGGSAIIHELDLQEIFSLE